VARSQTIWVVTNPNKVAASGPLATFTVKHECASWLDRHFTGGLRLWRCDDNPSDYAEGATVTEVDVEAFRAEMQAREERAIAREDRWRDLWAPKPDPFGA